MTLPVPEKWAVLGCCDWGVSLLLFSLHSRNQLSSLPPYICQLPLRVLIVSNNKLGALPPDIGTLGSLRQLVRMGNRARRGTVEPGTRDLWGRIWGKQEVSLRKGLD